MQSSTDTRPHFRQRKQLEALAVHCMESLPGAKHREWLVKARVYFRDQTVMCAYLKERGRRMAQVMSKGFRSVVLV